MAKKKGLYGVSVYVKNKPRKRPGRHAKSFNKRITARKKSRGQGWKILLKMDCKQLLII